MMPSAKHACNTRAGADLRALDALGLVAQPALLPPRLDEGEGVIPHCHSLSPYGIPIEKRMVGMGRNGSFALLPLRLARRLTL